MSPAPAICDRQGFHCSNNFNARHVKTMIVSKTDRSKGRRYSVEKRAFVATKQSCNCMELCCNMLRLTFVCRGRDYGESEGSNISKAFDVV